MTRPLVFVAVGALSLLPPSVSAAPPERAAPAQPVEVEPRAADSNERAELAYRWAPIHYQSVQRRGKNGLDGRADFLARVDFDGDWDARNDWENAARFPLVATVYQSVVETPSHWFIVYMFFHPRDWADSLFDTEHENDSEGVLLAVARDGSRFGRLKAAVTVAHSDFYSYVPRGSDWSAAAESVDGVLELDGRSGRPITAQEAQGHAFHAWKRNSSFDGIVYHPSRRAAPPPKPGDRVSTYVLADLFEAGGLWQRRAEPRLFARFGAFAGDRGGTCGAGGILCTRDGANAPWGWNDSDDGDVRRGDIALDPVRLASRYFAIPEPLQGFYSYNPYLSDRRPGGVEPPRFGGSEIARR